METEKIYCCDRNENDNAIAEDPDGYDGIIFRRWLSDYHTKVDMGLIKPINWEDYY